MVKNLKHLSFEELTGIKDMPQAIEIIKEIQKNFEQLSQLGIDISFDNFKATLSANN